MAFKSGDAVQLKTGGPRMNVEGEVDELLLCSWVGPTGKVWRQTYSERQLEAADETLELVAVTAIKRLASRWSVAATL
jgi:uncharacterized protein YodC (DUF2158 family)